ncbi:RNA-directed DNA polymerase, eukaryota [Tanacetum coccineum]
MKVMSLNICGMGRSCKRSWLRELTGKLKLAFLGIQETKKQVIDPFLISSFWGTDDFDFASNPSNGKSGGILNMWDRNSFFKKEVVLGDGFTAIIGNWRDVLGDFIMVNVYAPQNGHDKPKLWHEFDPNTTYFFNKFIDDAELQEVVMGARNFTRINKKGTKLSKLDRFLISTEVLQTWPTIHCTALPRKFSDHCPILMESNSADFGLVPFKFFNSWLNEDSINLLVKSSWGACDPSCNRPDVNLCRKLKALKAILKQWSKNLRHKSVQESALLTKHLEELDLKAEIGVLSESDCNLRFTENIPHRPRFHSNKFKKISELQKCFLERPFEYVEIKNAVWSCGEDKASGPDGFTFRFIRHFWNLIRDDFIKAVKHFETEKSIARGCNSSFISLIPKVSNPLLPQDFRPISLVGCYYKVLSKLLANRLESVMSTIISNVQTAFLKDRQITDGPLIINEVISWTKKVNGKLMIFKVDFEKAFDSINWNFIHDIMGQMGFGVKWRDWIFGCLRSGYSSILINGSPSKEFKLSKGLRQGDPLSPFLFIIAMEALHIALMEAREKGVFKGVEVGKNKAEISHLQYADDALLVGEWSEINITNLIRILRCFQVSSGLKVNLNKSRLMGVGVKNDEVKRVARSIKCKNGSLPFIYLGLPVGSSMRKITSWEPIVSKLHLSSKAKSLSFGGRLTLIKAVMSNLPTNFYYRLQIQLTMVEQILGKSMKDCNVSDRLLKLSGHLSTAWNWRRSIRNGREKEEMESLACLLEGVELKSGPDGWCWSLESSGKFSVKSLRVKLDEKILSLSHEKTRWNSLVPKKVKILVWRADNDSLATRCNLDEVY